MLKNPKIADKPSRMTSRLLLVSLLASTVGGTLLLSCSAHDGGDADEAIERQALT